VSGNVRAGHVDQFAAPWPAVTALQHFLNQPRDLCSMAHADADSQQKELRTRRTRIMSALILSVRRCRKKLDKTYCGL